MNDAQSNTHEQGRPLTLVITIPEGDELHVDREWVEKLNAEVRRIGRWFDENPECRAAYERWIG